MVWRDAAAFAEMRIEQQRSELAGRNVHLHVDRLAVSAFRAAAVTGAVPGAMKTTDPFSMNGILVLEDVGAAEHRDRPWQFGASQIVLQAIDVLYSHVDERLERLALGLREQLCPALVEHLAALEIDELVKVGRRHRIEWRWFLDRIQGASSQFRHAPQHGAAGIDEAAPLAGKMPVLEARDRRIKRFARHAGNHAPVDAAIQLSSGAARGQRHVVEQHDDRFLVLDPILAMATA